MCFREGPGLIQDTASPRAGRGTSHLCGYRPEETDCGSQPGARKSCSPRGSAPRKDPSPRQERLRPEEGTGLCLMETRCHPRAWSQCVTSMSVTSAVGPDHHTSTQPSVLLTPAHPHVNCPADARKESFHLSDSSPLRDGNFQLKIIKQRKRQDRQSKEERQSQSASDVGSQGSAL